MAALTPGMDAAFMESSSTPSPRRTGEGGQVGGQLAADGDRLACAVPGLHRLPQQLQHRGMERVGEPRHPCVSTLRGQRVLREVVRPDGQEVGVGGQRRRPERRRRDLDHGSSRELVPGSLAAATELVARQRQLGQRGAPLGAGGDHREQHADRVERGDAQDGAELHPEELGPGQAEADGALSEVGIALARQGEVGQRLVAAGVERPHGEWTPPQRLGGLEVERDLLLLARGLAPVEEEQLGAEDAHPLGAVHHRRPGVSRRADVGHHRHPSTIERHRRRGRGGASFRPGPALTPGPIQEHRHQRRWRVEPHAPGLAVDCERPSLQREQLLAQARHHRKAERAGEDGGVRGGRALRQGETGRALRLEPRHLGGRDVTGEGYPRCAPGIASVGARLRRRRAAGPTQLGKHELAQRAHLGRAGTLVLVLQACVRGGHLRHPAPPRRGAVEALPQGRPRWPEQRRIVEHEELRVEEGRRARPGASFDRLTLPLKPRPGPPARRRQRFPAGSLAGALAPRRRGVRSGHGGSDRLAKEPPRPERDPRRRSHPPQLAQRNPPGPAPGGRTPAPLTPPGSA